MPVLAAVTLLEEKLVRHVEESYVTTIHEEPAPAVDPVVDKDLPKVPLVAVKPEPEVKQPEQKVPEKSPEKVSVPKTLDVKVKETPVHPAADFTVKVPEPKGKDDDSFWTSPGAIVLYVVAGAAVATGIGLGAYFGTRDDGGPEPQPPIGVPVMGPGDKW